MRNITKGPEPPSLTAWRATNPTDYNGYPDKSGLRAALVEEQRGICCYCQIRIRPGTGKMKIEHWASHSGNSTLRLVYSNLLGACMGGEGQPREEQFCDTHKLHEALCRNPANPAHDVEAVLHYDNDGRMTSSNVLFDEQINSVLNLNVEFLVNSRKGVLNAVKEVLKIRGGSLRRRDWEQIIDDWSGANRDGALNPFCGVIIYWAKKHLARLQ